MADETLPNICKYIVNRLPLDARLDLSTQVLSLHIAMDLGSGVHKILPKPSEAGYKISDAVELTVPSCRFCLVFPLSHSEQGPSISFLWLFFTIFRGCLLPSSKACVYLRWCLLFTSALPLTSTPLLGVNQSFLVLFISLSLAGFHCIPEASAFSLNMASTCSTKISPR